MDDVNTTRPNQALIVALIAGMSLPLATPSAAQEPPPPRPENREMAETVAPPDDGPDAPLTNGLAGPFLAARMATVLNDYRAAANYFSEAVAQDPKDRYLQDGALVALISAGDVARAITLADQMATQGGGTELSALVRRVNLAQKGDWTGLLELLDADAKDINTKDNALLDGMMRAWALLGVGNASDALATFEEMAKARDVAPMVQYHLALARAMVGDYEGAQSLLSDRQAGDHLLGLTARVQILAQLERRDEAAALLDKVQGIEVEPQLVELREKLKSGEPITFDVVQTPADGLAQLLLTFASALAANPDPEPLSLIHARLAAWLSPELGTARLTVAQLLQERQQFDLAEREFEALRRMGEMRPIAELSRIDALASADRHDEAESAALSLTAAYPELPQAWVALGDLLRQQEKFAQAVPAYDKALSLLADAPPEERWFGLYARGIALERVGQFDRAEKDLLEAIEIQPEEPSLLNYLGYSWIDRNENLDRALELIRKAVELSPDDGYILDSLAWAYFRMGRYEEAVEPMEQAIATMSSDPLVNDHLGDIYWKVGRKREAEIQWQRALSLKPGESGEVDADRIRAKLERGLDRVLAEEKAAGESEQLPQPEAEAEAGAASAD
ncbi:tetratricopeptide repeat protein [Paracoccus alkanivorans]|nr:tetratricopeptide repeat protein [Paracoccus alkanivorans]